MWNELSDLGKVVASCLVGSQVGALPTHDGPWGSEANRETGVPVATLNWRNTGFRVSPEFTL